MSNQPTFRGGTGEVSFKRNFYKKACDLIKEFQDSGAMDRNLGVMSREERKIIHDIAGRRGLATKSTGKDPNRSISISFIQKCLKKTSSVVTEPIIPTEKAMNEISKFLERNPIGSREMDEFMRENIPKNQRISGGNSKNRMNVPPKATSSKQMIQERSRLPTFKYRSQILKSISENNVVIISGGTGCGKTTQVPQFLLEQACQNDRKVRIMVTQPRRIAAISIAERVAKERGENLGDVVGYQVRLENRLSDRTLLTYCTTGVLLRMLTADPIASGISHIIMDEIHEREINTDYLLIAIRECLKKRPDLKIILMSATIEGNMRLFAEYFQDLKVNVIRIESKNYEVKIFHLDEILAMSGYKPPDPTSFFPTMNFDPGQWTEELEAIRMEEEMAKNIEQLTVSNGNVYTDGGGATYFFSQLPAPPPPHLPQTTKYFDLPSQNSYIDYNSGNYHTEEGAIIEESTIENFMSAVEVPAEIRSIIVEFRPDSPDAVYINGVRHSADADQSPGTLQKQRADREAMPDFPVIFKCKPPPPLAPIKKIMPSPLLGPSLNGNAFGAPPTPMSASPMLPSKSSDGQSPNSLFSPGLSIYGNGNGFDGFGERQNQSAALNKKFREELLTALPNRTLYYHPQMNDQVENAEIWRLRLSEKYNLFIGGDFKSSIDHHLLNHVIKYLADSPVFGSILVFLPGYDDIQEMMTQIDTWKSELTNMKHVLVIPLHSQMHSMDHGEIFKPVNHDTRKIILATNIAEASITIEDVIFVVDTGKAKEKSYNHETKLSSLEVTPIAKSNAEQRAGRAGRVTNGYCIRLYSNAEFRKMPETQIAEMQRAAIYDVTLHAKIFAPTGTRVADFLALAPEPPSTESIEQSVEFLTQIGAFYRQNPENPGNSDPDLTELGILMSRLPLDPQLSRMLLFGLALKCLTPIINLVALLANRDPYILPPLNQRDDQQRKRMELAENDFSDHLLFIRLCSIFCTKKSHEQNKFCRDHLLNASTMRMIHGTRRQIIQELVRAKLIRIAPHRDFSTVLTDRNYNSMADSWPVIQAAIAAGCYPAIGVSPMDSKFKKVQTFHDEKAIVHPSSVVRKQVLKIAKQQFMGPKLEFLAFQELSQMMDKSLSVKMATAITGITAFLFTGSIRMSRSILAQFGIVSEMEDGEICDANAEKSPFAPIYDPFDIDEWYGIRAEKEKLLTFMRLRCKFMNYFMRGISDPTIFGQDTPRMDMDMLRAIRNLLESEHKRHKFNPVEMPNFFLKDYDYYEVASSYPRNRQNSMENQRKTFNQSPRFAHPSQRQPYANSQNQNFQNPTNSNFRNASSSSSQSFQNPQNLNSQDARNSPIFQNPPQNPRNSPNPNFLNSQNWTNSQQFQYPPPQQFQLSQYADFYNSSVQMSQAPPIYPQAPPPNFMGPQMGGFARRGGFTNNRVSSNGRYNGNHSYHYDSRNNNNN